MVPDYLGWTSPVPFLRSVTLDELTSLSSYFSHCKVERMTIMVPKGVSVRIKWVNDLNNMWHLVNVMWILAVIIVVASRKNPTHVKLSSKRKVVIFVPEEPEERGSSDIARKLPSISVCFSWLQDISDQCCGNKMALCSYTVALSLQRKKKKKSCEDLAEVSALVKYPFLFWGLSHVTSTDKPHGLRWLPV